MPGYATSSHNGRQIAATYFDSASGPMSNDDLLLHDDRSRSSNRRGLNGFILFRYLWHAALMAPGMSDEFNYWSLCAYNNQMSREEM